MNLPNILTMLRFVLAIGFIWALNQHGPWFVLLAIVLFSAASITDFLDGYFAKKRNLISNFGKIMDPIADKFLILSAFFIFMRMQLIAPWMFYLILGREVLVTVTRLMLASSGKFIAAEKTGKYKTVLQIVAIFLILFCALLTQSAWNPSWLAALLHSWNQAILIVMLFTVGLTVISGILYFWNNRQSFFSLSEHRHA